MACPKFVRPTFHEFAASSCKKSLWARAYYEQQRKRGADHHTAVRSLAYKWIRILYRCWKDRRPYDEQVYLKSLQPAPLAAGARCYVVLHSGGSWLKKK